MRTRLIAVVGNGGDLTTEQAQLAESLGAALVGAGYGVVCGGLGGVMEAVARGAVTARGAARHPPVVGILPYYLPEQGNDYLDIVLPTGLGHARNTLVASAGEAVVCVGGAAGALSEVALARKIGRPVLAFPASGGTADLATRALPSVIAVETPDDAVARIRELLG
ncbi:MAG: SLOG cluster 4 domain-containing protein [Planctomycetota bacterium]|jgi:uncharacterized protein (TIGR00725 family)